MIGRQAKRRLQKDRGRLDHILPQGYLAGFTSANRAGQLSVFNCKSRRWFETGAAGVGAVKGFYDYSPGANPMQTADDIFKPFEDKFPHVRRDLVSTDFANWEDHLEFLLVFAQMMRARSPLYREHVLTQTKNIGMARVERVIEERPIKDRPGEFETHLELNPSPITGTEREALVRNMAVTNMCGEIKHGAAWLAELNWCLLLAPDHRNPVITSNNAVIMEGKPPADVEALKREGTTIYFPLCRQACLVGRASKFAHRLELFDPATLTRIRGHYMQPQNAFVYSPSRVSY